MIERVPDRPPLRRPVCSHRRRRPKL